MYLKLLILITFMIRNMSALMNKEIMQVSKCNEYYYNLNYFFSIILGKEIIRFSYYSKERF